MEQTGVSAKTEDDSEGKDVKLKIAQNIKLLKGKLLFSVVFEYVHIFFQFSLFRLWFIIFSPVSLLIMAAL